MVLLLGIFICRNINNSTSLPLFLRLAMGAKETHRDRKPWWILLPYEEAPCPALANASLKKFSLSSAAAYKHDREQGKMRQRCLPRNRTALPSNERHRHHWIGINNNNSKNQFMSTPATTLDSTPWPAWPLQRWLSVIVLS